MRRACSFLLLSWLDLACAPSAPRVVPNPVVDAPLPAPATTSPPEPRATASLPEPKPESPITIPLPEKVLCPLTGGNAQTLPLAFSTSRPPFGTLQSARLVSAYIAEGDASAGIVVEGRAAGLFLRGVARPADVSLFANRVSVFGGLVVPKTTAALTLARARPDGLDLSLAAPDAVQLTGSRQLSGSLPCTVIGLAHEPFDAFENFFGVPLERADLRGGRIPLAREAGDKPVATLVLDKLTPPDVAVLDRDNGRARIAWEVEDVFVFGWVDAKALAPAAPRRERFGKIGLGTISTSGGCCEHRFLCADPVPLAVEQDGRTETVGTIDPGTPIRVRQMVGARHLVDFAGGFRPSSGTIAFVEQRHVAACQDLEVRARP